MRKQRGYWDKKENRVKEIRNAVEKMDKPLTQITKKDFIKIRLGGLIVKYDNLFQLLKEGGYGIKKREMKVVPKGYWDKKENRVDAVIHLVKKLRKNPSKITKEDFFKNGLATVVSKTGSYKSALREAGYDVSPKVDWTKKESRANAIRNMVGGLNKPLKDITTNDFKAHKLYGLLSKYYNTSPHRALKEAGYTIRRYEMHTKPANYWDKRERRIKAVRKMVERTGKQPREITANDFIANDLWGMLQIGYNASPFAALKDAGLVEHEWEMKCSPNYWNKKENRINSVNWVVEKTGKKPSEIRSADFTKYRMYGLLKRFKTYKEALREAGYNIEITAKNKPRFPRGYWNEKENRVNAVKNMVKKLDKSCNKITIKDFEKNGLSSLLTKYIDENCKSFSRGEFFTFDEGYLLEYKGRVKRALKEAELI
jgi:hypothetical protein